MPLQKPRVRKKKLLRLLEVDHSNAFRKTLLTAPPNTPRPVSTAPGTLRPNGLTMSRRPQPLSLKPRPDAPAQTLDDQTVGIFGKTL